MNENILKGKKPYRKGQPDHTHLVSFKSIKVIKLRESISNGSKKRKVDQNGKRHVLRVGASWQKWKWACGLDYNVETTLMSSFGRLVLFQPLDSGERGLAQVWVPKLLPPAMVRCRWYVLPPHLQWGTSYHDSKSPNTNTRFITKSNLTLGFLHKCS